MSRAAGLGWALAELGLWALSVVLWLSANPGAWAQEPLALVLRQDGKGEALWCAPVWPQQEFVVEFVHSYERLPVRERYKILGPGKISFEGLVTRSVLNGQGFLASEIHTSPDGWLQTGAVRTMLERVEFIMGGKEHADHRILLGGKRHFLNKEVPAGALVLLGAEEGLCSLPNP